MMGMFFTASAQMCRTTGGVEPTITSGSSCDEIKVNLENTNSYKVTVVLDVTQHHKEGNSVQRTKTVVIPANNKKKEVKFRTKKVKGETKCADVPECSVSLRVEMCE